MKSLAFSGDHLSTEQAKALFTELGKGGAFGQLDEITLNFNEAKVSKEAFLLMMKCLH